MRLARYFGGDARSGLKGGVSLRVAEIKNAKRIEREITPAWANGRSTYPNPPHFFGGFCESALRQQQRREFVSYMRRATDTVPAPEYGSESRAVFPFCG